MRVGGYMVFFQLFPLMREQMQPPRAKVLHLESFVKVHHSLQYVRVLRVQVAVVITVISFQSTSHTVITNDERAIYYCH